MPMECLVQKLGVEGGGGREKERMSRDTKAFVMKLQKTKDMKMIFKASRKKSLVPRVSLFGI